MAYNMILNLCNQTGAFLKDIKGSLTKLMHNIVNIIYNIIWFLMIAISLLFYLKKDVVTNEIIFHGCINFEKKVNKIVFNKIIKI